jgi:adhesin/invasin
MNVSGSPDPATTTITLRAKDAFGNNLTTGGLTVVFSTSAQAGEGDGTFGTVSDNGDGTYTVTFTATTAGTATTISATIGGNAVASTTQVVIGP